TTTLPGVAFARCDYATTIDTVQFAAGETSKTITIPLIDDAHTEGNEAINLELTTVSGGAKGEQSTATVTITDNDPNPNAPNPVLASREFFVRQQYLDFLSREPEPGGFQDWLNVLAGCPNIDIPPTTPSGCDRIHVSGIGFFDSPEFRLKGLYVFLFYRVALDRLAEYTEIATDLRSVTGVTGPDTLARRAAFAEAFTQRSAFRDLFPTTMSNEAFVAALLDRYNLQQIMTENPANPDGTEEVVLTRQQLVSQLTSGALTRTQVLRAVVQSREVEAAERNPAFVAIQYYGYLRRTPEEPGYTNNVNTLNQNPNGFRLVIHNFLNSPEYQLRFGRIER
ncbi:MAG: hypothetical protein LC742_01775, partial [Acidobacteria bacterium]|nr:hypothetical protein [Acidobacteriota bacterium]